VVDCGRVKRRAWDLRAGTSRFEVGWVSQASADQRAGRAGRTGPGHAYRLYSSAVFQERFSSFEPPETETMPLDAMVLQLKRMGIRSVQAFPFPSPPPRHALVSALRSLAALGIVTLTPGHAATVGPAGAASARGAAGRGDEETLTALGRRVSELPVSPSLAKMLVLASRGGGDLLAWVSAVVAGMTVDDPFVTTQRRRPEDIKRAARARAAEAAGSGEAESLRRLEAGSDEEEDDDDDHYGRGEGDDDEEDEDPTSLAKAASAAKTQAEAAELDERRKHAEAGRIAHARVRHASGDALTLLRLIGAHAHACVDGPSGRLDGAASVAWCRDHYVRHKPLKEAHLLRRQLHARMAAAEDDDALLDGTADAAEADDDEAAATAADAPSSAAAARPFPAHLPRLGADGEGLVLQTVTAGLLHRVMRRATAEEAADLLPKHGLSLHTGGGRAGSRVPYVPADSRTPKPLFVHPRSALCRDDVGDMPDLIAASDIVQSSGATRRHLLRGCSEVDGDVLADAAAGTPLVLVGPALPAPQPDFHAPSDAVRAWHEPLFGDARWRLPAVPRPVRDDAVAARCFGRALLEGRVVPSLRPFAAHAVAPPDLITKGGSQSRVRVLLAALAAHDPPTASRAALAHRWASDPSYLLLELKLWLPAAQAAALAQAWPAIVAAEADAAPEAAPASKASSKAAAKASSKESPKASAKDAAKDAAPAPKVRRKRARSAKRAGAKAPATGKRARAAE